MKQDSEVKHPQVTYPNRFSRRVGKTQRLPHISEECKRRLLCELHSRAVNQQIPSPGHRHCYKIPCEAPEEMTKVLQWVTRRPVHLAADRGDIT